MREVYVVTCVELGWDCVVGVYASEEALCNSWLFDDDDERPSNLDEVEKALGSAYFIFQKTVEE